MTLISGRNFNSIHPAVPEKKILDGLTDRWTNGQQIDLFFKILVRIPKH